MNLQEIQDFGSIHMLSSPVCDKSRRYEIGWLNSMKDLFQIADGDYGFPQSKWGSISENAVDLVKKLMNVNAKQRLSACQV